MILQVIIAMLQAMNMVQELILVFKLGMTLERKQLKPHLVSGQGIMTATLKDTVMQSTIGNKF